MVAVTGLYAGILALFLIFLALRVVKLRWSEKVGLGTGESRVLLQAVRAHGNFAEHIPLALIILGLVELSGGWKSFIHFLGICLILSRIMHLKGLSQSAGSSRGRMYGSVLMFGSMIMGGLYLIVGFFIGSFS